MEAKQLLRAALRYKLYWVLLAIRLAIALAATSTIHPDEHFQNPEVAASDVFAYSSASDGPLRTWEWTADAPCRSIVPVWLSVGAAFKVLKFLGSSTPSARQLLTAQRLTMFVLSLCIDMLLWAITSSYDTLLFFSTSPVLLTFLLRPFSNSIETLLLASALFLVYQCVTNPITRVPDLWSGVLGAVLALGVFVRVTFLAFASPIVLAVTYLAIEQTPTADVSFEGLVEVVSQFTSASIGFSATAILLTIADSLYFQGKDEIFKIIRTPLNSLNFNFSTSNLAAHGLHPRYLHILVNLPMLFGVGIIGAGIVALETWRWRKVDAGQLASKKGQDEFMRRVCLAILVIPTLLLSVIPHQEPRFLAALIIPLVILLPNSPSFKTETAKARRHRRYFWSAWLLHSIIFTVIFGFLHQGGLIPSLLKINDSLLLANAQSSSVPTGLPKGSIDFVFWRTFMPPRHLVVPLTDSVYPIHFTDLAGAPIPDLLAKLSSLSSNPKSSVLLVAPSYAIDQLDLANPECLVEAWEESVGIHFDMDRIGAIFESGWEKAGVGLWQVAEDCLLSK